MVEVAANADQLIRRVRYFIEKEKARDMQLARLLDEIEAPAYLFGGVVRDLALYGKKELTKREPDIDIVCAGRGRAVDRFFSRLERQDGVLRNRFGGFRFLTGHWKVDLWAAEDTWAFREGKCGYKSVESLLRTTITNWEAILFRLDSRALIYREGYFRDLREGYLDVVSSENPNLLGMYVRLVRACINWPVQYLSERTRKVVCEAMAKYTLKDMMSYEKEHYRRQYIDGPAFGCVTSAALANGDGAVPIARPERTGGLFR